ncbi:hypothetical protein FHS54_001534 [Sphingobium vermicomposti]|uniref:Uncharacterized protein n=1 Tax=Sphingobium vermicomposti TaxID=529005 RepID=A0A846M5Y9_9SPHN|nr:hypothetical protein [Sphingobium vermicomposti]
MAEAILPNAPLVTLTNPKESFIHHASPFALSLSKGSTSSGRALEGRRRLRQAQPERGGFD